MNSLRESLEELLQASAEKVLAEGASPEGAQALARVTLLLGMIDRLDASETPWQDCDLVPARVSLVTSLEGPCETALPQ